MRNDCDRDRMKNKGRQPGTRKMEERKSKKKIRKRGRDWGKCINTSNHGFKFRSMPSSTGKIYRSTHHPVLVPATSRGCGSFAWGRGALRGPCAASHEAAAASTRLARPRATSGGCTGATVASETMTQ